MTNVIKTERLTKYYGARCVVNGLNFGIPAGTVYGFLGRNGAGKSTTIKMLLGFVGYERETNRRFGFIGRSGFRPAPLPADEGIPVRSPFLLNSSQWSSAPISIDSGRAWSARPDDSDIPPHLVYVPSENRLRKVDLAERTIQTVLETPEPIESIGIPLLANYHSGRFAKVQPILVRTRQQIQALNHKLEVTKVIAIPTEADRQNMVHWFELEDGHAFVEFVQPWSTRGHDTIAPRIVYRIAGDGAIQDRFELALQSGMLAWAQQPEAVQIALALPAPAALFLIEHLFVMGINQVRSYREAVSERLKSSWPSLIAAVALALTLAALAGRKCRAFGFPRRERVVWVVFVLLLGVPAFAGFLLHRRWPIRERCLNCHAPSPRDRAACATCETSFPDPALKGIEIFA